ncbi:MAG: GGDEF domain-containing protein [Acidobacteriaceae bacterium]
MPRQPLLRTFFAILPIAGALLAALAGHRGWPIVLSLFAMAVTALASAVIYWSAPLSKQWREQATAPRVVETVVPVVVSEIAAAADQLEEVASEPAQEMVSSPEPGSIGTRADALATGEWRETDLLTTLLNSKAFAFRLRSELERCKAADLTAILVICDLDSFGSINQTVGLVDANRLLRQVADCFRLTVREGDVLSRLGGDEFGIFFPGLPPEVAEARVRDLRAAVREAGLLTLEENSPQVTACIGISSFPADGDTAVALLAAANTSLAIAKRERQEKATLPIPSALVVTRN